MQNLVRTNLPPFPTLCGIIESKQEPRLSILTALEPDLSVRFGEYGGNTQDLSQIAKRVYSAEQREALEHCYTVQTTALARLLTSIQDAQPPAVRDQCPYCGMATADTWDHYLSQNDYPEFAVHAWNLVPCCAKCNSKKLHILVINGQRQFVNFYFDALPAERFLFTSVTWTNGVPRATYVLERDPRIPDETWALIERHFRRLGLLTRFRREAHRFLAYVHTSVGTNCAGRGPRFYSKHLLKESATWARTHTVNDWRSTLYEELSRTQHLPHIRDWAAVECRLPPVDPTGTP